MVALRRATRSKTTLPLVRKKLKDYGSIAVRGSNELHEVNQKQSDHRKELYNPFHNSVVIDSNFLNRESTRKYISRIGNSIIVAMGYAFRYSNFEYTLDKNHMPRISYDEKNKPVIAVSFNSNIGDKQPITISDNLRLKGTNIDNFIGEKSTSVRVDSKDTHYITIDKKDLVDLTNAWKLELSKHQGNIVGYNILFNNFLNNFLARRIITKALKAQKSFIK
ncbi:MAG: hypothetical protein WCX82_01510 [archaeon]|jgi:hypothetical protein